MNRRNTLKAGAITVFGAAFPFSGVQAQNRHAKYAGKTVVFTGKLETMSRDEAAEKIRTLGGTFQTAVAKDTTYLVAGGKVGASKLKKAESYGTKIISEKELLRIIQ